MLLFFKWSQRAKEAALNRGNSYIATAMDEPDLDDPTVDDFGEID